MLNPENQDGSQVGAVERGRGGGRGGCERRGVAEGRGCCYRKLASGEITVHVSQKSESGR